MHLVQNNRKSIVREQNYFPTINDQREIMCQLSKMHLVFLLNHLSVENSLAFS